MIAGEQDDRVIENALHPKRADEIANLMIDLGGECVERALGLQHLFSGVEPSATKKGGDRIGYAIRVSGPVADIGLIDLDISIEFHVGLGRHERRVRMAKAQIPKRGLGRVAPLDNARHAPTRPSRGVMFLRLVPGPPMILIIGHAVIELASGVALIAKIDVVVVERSPLRPAFVIQKDAVKTNSIPLRLHMQLADRICLVAGIAKRLCHGDGIRHAKLIVENAIAMRLRAHPGHQGAPCRNAHRTFGIGVGVAHARRGNFVQTWR